MNGFAGVLLTLPEWIALMRLWWIAPGIYLLLHIFLFSRLSRLKGRALTPLLGMTATLMLLYCATYFCVALAG